MVTFRGLGYTDDYINSLTADDAYQLMRKAVIFEIPMLFTAITACWLSKLSFFITLLRIVQSRGQKYVVWFAMSSSSFLLISLSIIQPFVQCNDIFLTENCVPASIAVPYGSAAYAYAALMVRPVSNSVSLPCANVGDPSLGLPPRHGSDMDHVENANTTASENCHHLCNEHGLLVSYALQRPYIPTICQNHAC